MTIVTDDQTNMSLSNCEKAHQGNLDKAGQFVFN